MFGYVVINESELKLKDYDTYRSFYCGICSSLSRYGLTGRVTLSYDMVFVAMLLSDLYDDDTKPVHKRCFVHPIKSTQRMLNKYVDYAADMTILLAYYQCMDHWHDDGNIMYKLEGDLLSSKAKSLFEKWPRQAQAIEKYINDLVEIEKHQDCDPETVAALTGSMMAELLVYKEDEWSPTLRALGNFLGKYVYLMDAFDDVDKDIRKGNYNPFAKTYDPATFEETVANMLTYDLAECASAYERLPLVEYSDILRNIIYSGVWIRFDQIKARRQYEAERRAAKEKK
ncbi:MAG: hypothetical protein IKV30_01330 [Clostridia bacterium]|nr:hypothetical protein [Clostridia bacterium]